MTVQGNLGVERMCQLAEVSRASFYRSLQKQAPAEDDVEVRIQIQVGGGPLHGDDGAAQGALLCIGAEAASVPAEDGIDEDARLLQLFLLLGHRNRCSNTAAWDSPTAENTR